MFKYDTHVHTSETSPCGGISASDVVRAYKDADYEGVIITDHFGHYFFDPISGISWKEKVDLYLKGYRKALAEGDKAGLKVLLGMEILFKGSPNDYLIYGFDESFLYENPEMYLLGLEEFRNLVKGSDILIFQAHPFRNYVTPADPKLLDGVEIFNGNKRHDSRDNLAEQFASNHHLLKISGSDFHEYEDLSRGGIITKYPILNEKNLVKLLKSGAYSLIKA